LTEWRVTWTKTAESYYKRMAREYQQKVQEVVRELESAPSSSRNVKRLHGEMEGLCRYRIGKLRMVFRVVEESNEVIIIAIASRGDIYK